MSHPKFPEVATLEFLMFPREDQGSGRAARRIPIGEVVTQGIVNNETLGYFIGHVYFFLTLLGIDRDRLRLRQHLANEMAHYAADCWDAEIECSYGWTDFIQHMICVITLIIRWAVAHEKFPEPIEMKEANGDESNYGSQRRGGVFCTLDKVVSIKTPLNRLCLSLFSKTSLNHLASISLCMTSSHIFFGRLLSLLEGPKLTDSTRRTASIALRQTKKFKSVLHYMTIVVVSPKYYIYVHIYMFSVFSFTLLGCISKWMVLEFYNFSG